VALLVAAGGVYYYGAQKERVAAVSFAQASQDNKDLAAQLRALEKRPAAAPAPKLAPREAGQALMAANPALREMLLAEQKALGVGQVSRIARAMNLSPSQIGQLVEIFAQSSSSNTCPVPGYGAVTFDIGSVPRDEIPALLRAVLGDAGYAEFQRLRHLLVNIDTTPFGAMCPSRELSARLCFTDEPLTSRQAWGIDEINYDLIDHRGDAGPEALWEKFQERAASLLSPGQMRALADIGDRYIYRQIILNAQRADGKAATARSP